MPFTEEFYNVFRKNKRITENIDEAFERAKEQAQTLGLEIYRERKERNSNTTWKKQKNATFPYLDI